MKRLYILILILHVAVMAQAQSQKVKDAIKQLQEKNLETAQQLIDEAAEHDETSGQASTWYYKGFIYKELYKKHDAHNPDSKHRITSMESFKKALKLDSEGKFTENNKKNIKFHSSTFYNDAVKTLNKDEYTISLKNFDRYKDASRIVDPNADLKDKTIEFNLGLTTVYMELYETNKDENKGFLQKTKDTYNNVLKLDPKNLSANYNMGVLYYNQAVNIILDLEYDTDMIALSEIQDNCIKLFRESLPFMERALELDPNNINTLKGLSGIYYSLNEIEKSEEIKKTIEQLEKGEK